jgi:hypothetical protein
MLQRVRAWIIIKQIIYIFTIYLPACPLNPPEGDLKEDVNIYNAAF